jgi:hypothetical protein
MINSTAYNFTVGSILYPSKTAGALSDNVTTLNTNNAMIQTFGIARRNNTVFVNPAYILVEYTE